MTDKKDFEDAVKAEIDQQEIRAEAHRRRASARRTKFATDPDPMFFFLGMAFAVGIIVGRIRGA